MQLCRRRLTAKGSIGSTDSIGVSNTATLAQDSLNSPPPKKSGVTVGIFLVGTVLLAVMLVGSGWIYVEGTRGLSRLSKTYSSEAGAATQGPIDPSSVPVLLREAESKS